MTISFKCTCGTALETSGQHAGGHMRCYACGASVEIPTPAAAAPVPSPDAAAGSTSAAVERLLAR